MKSLNILKNEDYLLIQNEINELPYIVKKSKKKTGNEDHFKSFSNEHKIKRTPIKSD